jgi:transposase
LYHLTLSKSRCVLVQKAHTLLFPEFTQVLADPTRHTEVETLGTFLRELAPRHYGLPTAQELVGLAKASISSGVAVAARSASLRILCDQLDHTQKNLE